MYTKYSLKLENSFKLNNNFYLISKEIIHNILKEDSFSSLYEKLTINSFIINKYNYNNDEQDKYVRLTAKEYGQILDASLESTSKLKKILSIYLF